MFKKAPFETWSYTCLDDIFKDTDFNDDGTFNCVVYYLAG